MQLIVSLSVMMLHSHALKQKHMVQGLAAKALLSPTPELPMRSCLYLVKKDFKCFSQPLPKVAKFLDR